MESALKIVTHPTIEPVTLAEAKTQVVIDSSITADDDLLNSLIKVARRHSEKLCRRALITQTWDLFLDDWPEDDFIQLHRPPLQTVSYVKYTDSAGVVTTWDTSNYVVDANKEPGRVVLAYGKTWPTATLTTSSAIQIRFVVGYGDAASNVPEEYKAAIKLLLAHLYVNREATTELALREVPMAVEALLGIDANFARLQ